MQIFYGLINKKMLKIPIFYCKEIVKEDGF